MKRVVGEELETIRPFFTEAAEVAAKSTCLRAHCGSVIVKDGEVIGEGYNSPPLDDEARRTCDRVWDVTKKPTYDRTCCVHAEWRAVIDACKKHPDMIAGAVLYFMRLDESGNFTDAGDPFCTTCSRLTMESGVSAFALWNQGGADIYPIAEYDEKSYAFYAPER